MDYLQNLNEPQQEGVINTEGPCMIIAGAGSGKTRVLTYRIAHLIKNKGVSPFSIMALTFTNKAAKQMRQRIEEVVGAAARDIWMGTFHAVFARILRIESEYLGYPGNFTIYDNQDSVTLTKTIIKEMKLDDEQYKATSVFGRISAVKNRLISWQDYQNNAMLINDDTARGRPEIANIYREYAQRSFKSGAMDFDDLLFNTDKLLKEYPDVLHKYQHQIRYVLVDEFQDTNLCQYFIIRRLTAVEQNICVVGDDAQSIYAFRGADISNILNFEKDHPGLHAVRLEQNYRSTKTIVSAANSVIEKNTAQLPKSIWTSNGEGKPIELFRAMSDNEEGKLVASSIFEEKMQRRLSFNDFAILYRTNSQSRVLEEALRRVNIKYKIVGGFSFYQRSEVKDLLAYLRAALNQKDEVSLRRIINSPKRGIGGSTVEKITTAAQNNNISFWEALRNAHTFPGRRERNAVENFVDIISRCSKKVQGENAYRAALYIANHSGMLKALREDKTIAGQSCYDNVQEALNAVREFSEDSERSDGSLGAFLQEAALLTGQDEENEEDADTEKVTLMTIHMAKGLEFKYVYIVGLEEGLFPSQPMLSSQADLEEERRVFYVAMTRAKERLLLSCALSRYRYGKLKSCEPSRFLEDIDPQYIKMSNHATAGHFVPKTDYAQRLMHNIRKTQPKSFLPEPQNKQQRRKYPGSFTPSDASTLQEGMKVEHPKFGLGTITAISESGSHQKAVIHFNSFGKKTLLLSFAKLRIYKNRV